MALAFNGKGGGGTAFNGGTITDELVVNTGTSTTKQALELQGTRTVGADVFRIDYPHTAVLIDSDGVVQFASDDSLGFSLSGTSGAGAVLSVGTDATDRVNIAFSTASGLQLVQHGTGNSNIIIIDANGNAVFGAGTAFGGGIVTSPQQSGALPTTSFVSGTGKQVDTNSDRHLVVPFTGDATNNAATLLIQLSADNVTYSTLDTLSVAAALNLTGALNTPVSLYVPAGWYVKLTATHGTIGTATYY